MSRISELSISGSLGPSRAHVETDLFILHVIYCWIFLGQSENSKHLGPRNPAALGQFM